MLVGPTASVPLTVLAGPSGIGRSALLTAVCARLSEQDVPTVLIRVTPRERDRPLAVAARLLGELTMLAESARPTDAAEDNPTTARWPADRAGFSAALASQLGRLAGAHRHLLVAFDDLQWSDPESVAVLAALRNTVGGSIACVCAVRSPSTGPAAEIGAGLLARLRAGGRAEVVAVRPLPMGEVGSLVAEVLGARPAGAFVAALRRECRGVPAAVLAAVDGYQRVGALRVVDRCAYLGEPDRPAELPEEHAFFEQLRGLGPAALPVAKAIAVLGPLGGEIGGLVAGAVGLDEARVGEILGILRSEGVLRSGPQLAGFRFRVPLMASVLTGCLGPFERRRLSQLAVTEVWEGRVACADDTYLAERIADAGRLLDPARAAQELLAKGGAIMMDNGYFAQRWLSAASELTADPDTRAGTLFLHAATCAIHMMFQPAIGSVATVLREHASTFPASALQELQIIYVVALRGINDTETLTELVADGWRKLPGDPAHQVVTRAAAMCMLNGWRRASEFLAAETAIWQDSNDASVAYALVFAAGSAGLIGRGEEFGRFVADMSRMPLLDVDRHRLEHTAALSRVLLLQGELGHAQRLYTEQGVPDSQLPLVDKAVVLSLSGDWEQALELARLAMATGASLGFTPGHTGMCREMAIILLARGRLGQARAVIEQARVDQPVLLHLLDAVEHDIELALGATGRAKELLIGGLATADRDGVAIGADELLLRLVVGECADGNRQRAAGHATELARFVESAGNERALRNQLLAKVAIDRDATAAQEVVAMCRRRGQAFELAETLTFVAERGLGDGGRLLTEAYRLYGDLDALLPRSRLRRLMRDTGVAIPGRNTTVTENERLLAALVIEGLTNRQLATVLMTSEKGVEGRLSRLFQRTGYRSRIELGMAKLTGDYPG